MQIDHIGYAVRDMCKAVNSFEQLGYSKQDMYEDEKRGISICFMRNGEYRIELVSPMRAGSPVEEILKKSGDTPYHICYRCTNLDETIRNMAKSKFCTVIEPEEAIAFGGKRVVFLFSLSVGLIEVVEV